MKFNPPAIPIANRNSSACHTRRVSEEREDVAFRKLHFELAFTYVRQWDSRKDEEIQGTGGTPFMPYLRKHRRTTHEALIDARTRGGADEGAAAAA